MRNRLAIFCFLLVTSCIESLHGADPAPPAKASTKTPADNSARSLAEILEAWNKRQARSEAIECVWQIVGQMRTPAFQIAAGNSQSPAPPVRVTWIPTTLRVAGQCEPVVHLGSDFVPDGAWVTRSSELEFTGVLNSRLDEQTLRSTTPLPYLIETSGDRQIHSWQKPKGAPHGVAILPAGSFGLLLPYDASKAVHLPALWGVNEAMRLAFCPDQLFGSEPLQERGKLLPERPRVRGKECLAVEFPLKAFPESKLICRLWIDSSPDRRIVRASLGPAKSSVVQYDLDYGSQPDASIVPARVTITQFNGHGDPHDELVAVRTELKPAAERKPNQSSASFPPGALVVDLIAVKQYRVGANGQQTPATVAEIAQEFGLNVDLAAIDPTTVTWSRFLQDLFFKMVTWPWILATLGGVYAIWQITTKLFQRLKRKPPDLEPSSKPPELEVNSGHPP